MISAIEINNVTYRYGDRTALDDLSLVIGSGEVFAFLGPNGSGKTTLFRLLSTLMPLQYGNINVAGFDVSKQTNAVRAKLGVVFQAASVDKKLTVEENLFHQGLLYGLAGRVLRRRTDEMLERLGMADRRKDYVEQLSGGLRRRVELAGGLLHQPAILLLDEPSTGLDPAARSDLWEYLFNLRKEQGTTIVLTTHLLEEADRADKIAILHQGRLVVSDTPDALRSAVGGDSITITSADLASLARMIEEKFDCKVLSFEGMLRLEQPDGHRWISRLVEAFPEQIETITLGKPTLEDVFIDRTGHRFWNEQKADI